MNTAWHFATIAFQPYPDVGEFVNVGALAVAVPDRLLAYRLLTANATTRIQAFFPELDLTVYREGRQRLEAELKRLENAVNHTLDGDLNQHRVPAGQQLLPGFGGQADLLFKSLTAPRDGLFRFHAKGVRMAMSKENLLDSIFARYVIRVTADQNGQEMEHLMPNA